MGLRTRLYNKLKSITHQHKSATFITVEMTDLVDDYIEDYSEVQLNSEQIKAIQELAQSGNLTLQSSLQAIDDIGRTVINEFSDRQKLEELVYSLRNDLAALPYDLYFKTYGEIGKSIQIYNAFTQQHTYELIAKVLSNSLGERIRPSGMPTGKIPMILGVAGDA